MKGAVLECGLIFQEMVDLKFDAAAPQDGDEYLFAMSYRLGYRT